MLRIATYFLVTGLTAAACLAQDAPIVNKGTLEIGGFVGASYGTQNFQVMGGGNVAYAVTKYIMPYAEFSYFPGLPITKPFAGVGDSGTKATVDYRIPLADFHVGVHIRIPVKEKPFVPYGVFGLGLLHNYDADYNLNYTQFGKPITTTNTLAADNSFGVNFGGGIRYYTKQKVGFRIEAKVYHIGGTIDSFFSKYEFGVFYQFH